MSPPGTRDGQFARNFKVLPLDFAAYRWAAPATPSSAKWSSCQSPTQNQGTRAGKEVLKRQQPCGAQCALYRLPNGVCDCGVCQVEHVRLSSSLQAHHILKPAVDPERFGVIATGPTHRFDKVPFDAVGQRDLLRPLCIKYEVTRAHWFTRINLLPRQTAVVAGARPLAIRTEI